MVFIFILYIKINKIFTEVNLYVAFIKVNLIVKNFTKQIKKSYNIVGGKHQTLIERGIWMKVQMGKLIITQGVNELQEKMNIYKLFSVANKFHTDINYFIVFKPHGEITLVEDGNGKRLDTLGMSIPNQLFCIRDNYGSEYVTTMLLPEEY
jgi:hypothetical protein